MSCASCAAKIERGLNDLDGVRATVNFAVERAHVEHGAQVSEHDLIHAVESTGYHASLIDHSIGESHMNHDVPADQLRPRLIGSAVLALPVLALSMVMPWQFPGWQWVVLALTTPIVVWGGYPFHKAALNSARHGSSTMDTLVSIGTLAAFLWSVVAVVTGHGHVYFEVAAAVTVFLLGGRYAEAKAKRSAGAALQALLSLGAKDAIVVRDDAEVRIPVADLRVGDVIVVRPGERVATDGVVVDGVSALDTSAMTGESVPVDVGPGAEVLGGAVNTYGRILVRAKKVGADTQLARMARMVSDAQSGKASIQRLADRVSAVFVPAVLIIAAVTLTAWLLSGHSAAAAFTAAVAVLIIACPCALGLATPTAILVGTGRGAQLGVLIKEPQVLETVRDIDTVVLDKTVLGYQLKAVGFNRHAAEYAGISVNRNIVLSMMIAGALSGLGGAAIYTGYASSMQIGVMPSQGFDGIAVALLGANTPVGVVGAALFFGVLQSGKGFMNAMTDIPPEIGDTIIASIIYFAATSVLIRNLIERARRRFAK